MDKEFVQLKSLLTSITTERYHHKDFVSGRMDNKDIVLQKCGIGKVNSAIGCVEMIDRYNPDIIISSGCAGGVGEELEVGDAVVSTSCMYHDAYCGDDCAYGQIMGMPLHYPSPRHLVDKALQMDCKVKVHAGEIVSGEWFVNSKAKMQDILSHCPKAMAVDMESCAIAQTCYTYKVPFVSFRIISDLPLKDHKAQMYFDFWNRMAEGSFNVTKEFVRCL